MDEHGCCQFEALQHYCCSNITKILSTTVENLLKSNFIISFLPGTMYSGFSNVLSTKSLLYALRWSNSDQHLGLCLTLFLDL